MSDTQEHATFAKAHLRREALWRSRGFRRLHLLSLSLSPSLPAFWHSPSSANQDSFSLSDSLSGENATEKKSTLGTLGVKSGKSEAEGAAAETSMDWIDRADPSM